jgi:hypothetical protein
MILVRLDVYFLNIIVIYSESVNNRRCTMQSLISLTNHLTQPLDLARIAWLRLTMKNIFIRKIYGDRTQRLAVNFVFLSGLYLLISLKWSFLMLVLGPVLLGYPHLIASYRFLQKPLQKEKFFSLFLFLTFISLVIRFILVPFEILPQLPYGAYEILLSASAIAFLKIPYRWPVKIMTLFFVALFLRLAWFNPLAFVGIALILHNWVAFGHWILAAQSANDRFVAMGATLVFGAVHVLVFYGFFDTWISFVKPDVLSTISFEVKGWILAPWSNDPLIWSRAIVLYTFGLSLHYFVWLQAIPQCLDPNPVPNSFRRSLDLMRADCGPRTTIILLLGGIATLGIWIFTNYAGRIYFGVAMLHGWLELTFLLASICAIAFKSFQFN